MCGGGLEGSVKDNTGVAHSFIYRVVQFTHDKNTIEPTCISINN